MRATPRPQTCPHGSRRLRYGPIHPPGRSRAAWAASEAVRRRHPHLRTRAQLTSHSRKTKRDSRRPWRRRRAPRAALLGAARSPAIPTINPRPVAPHPAALRAPVDRREAKTRVSSNACRAIWAQSRGFKAAGGGLRTVRSRRSAPIEPSEVLARQAEHPEGGGREKRPKCQHPEDAGRTAQSATIGDRSDEVCGRAMAGEAGGYRLRIKVGIEGVLPARCDAASTPG